MSLSYRPSKRDFSQSKQAKVNQPRQNNLAKLPHVISPGETQKVAVPNKDAEV